MGRQGLCKLRQLSPHAAMQKGGSIAGSLYSLGLRSENPKLEACEAFLGRLRVVGSIAMHQQPTLMLPQKRRNEIYEDMAWRLLAVVKSGKVGELRKMSGKWADCLHLEEEAS